MGKYTNYLIISCFVTIIVLSACAVARENNPNITKKRENVYYTVTGKTSRELSKSIDKNGPYNERHKRRWAGYADIEYTYNYDTLANKKMCKLNGLRIEFLAKVTLPKWKDEVFADAKTKAWWDKMITRLELHEEGHVRIAERMLPRLYERMSVAEPTANCDLMKKKLEQISIDVGQTMQLQQIAYDKRTQHGKKQNGYIPFADELVAH